MLTELYKLRIKKEYLTEFVRSDKVVDKSCYDYLIRNNGSLYGGHYEGNIYKITKSHGSFIYIDNAGYEEIVINAREWLLAKEEDIESYMLEERKLWRKPRKEIKKR